MDTSNQYDLPLMDIIPVIKTTYPLGYNTRYQKDLTVMDRIRILKTT